VERRSALPYRKSDGPHPHDPGTRCRSIHPVPILSLAARLRQKLARLLEEPAFGVAAQVFAERYAGLDVKAIPSRFATLAERVPGQ
jgi:hypothetical protein